MKHTLSIILIFTLILSFLICGCDHKRYDKEQTYHDGYEELEHFINSELGDYLTIEKYQEPIDDNGYLVINVFFRSSYCDDSNKVEQTPIWFIVDNFRCLFNEFLREHENYFSGRVSRYDIVFCIDEGNYIDTSIARLRNYVDVQNAYSINDDYIITEEVHCDIGNLNNKDELIYLYASYCGEINDPSIDQCVDYFCNQLELFPNLRYFRIVYAPLPQSEWSIVSERIVERNSNLSSI